MTRDEPKLEPRIDDVPKLPRGRGLTLSGPQLVRILGLVLLLVFLVVMQRPCAHAVSTFVTSFGEQGSAATEMPRPDNLDSPTGSAGSGSGRGGQDGEASVEPPTGDYESLRPGMTDDEVKAAIDRARARAAGSDAAR